MPLRRKILAALAALLLLLSGCAGRRMEPEDVDFQFDCMVDVQYPGGSASCSFQRAGPQSASVQVISGGPQGLAWSWSGDGFTSMYLGLAAKSDACPLPRDSFARLLVETLDAAERPGALTWTRDCEFSGNAGHDFTLTADPQTGKVLTLSVPECGFEAKFYSYAQKTIEVDLSLEPVPD